ncbi:MAG: shikimate dehydrogenase [Pseudomonadota bacterium]
MRSIDALSVLQTLGFRGINVTLPHKAAVFALADETTERARLAGAANTLTFDGDRILADNTDGYGFVASLVQAAGPDVLSYPTVILGAGGAARGIVGSLLEAGIPDVVLANRTDVRAVDLASTFDDRVSVGPWTNPFGGRSEPVLLVNTTSLGMVGQPPLDLALDDLPDGSVVADIVYTPLETSLLASARRRGLVGVDGLGMLLHQAAPGFERWFGVRPEVDSDLRRAVLA